jgi:hypothetical protein
LKDVDDDDDDDDDKTLLEVSWIGMQGQENVRSEAGRHKGTDSSFAF